MLMDFVMFIGELVFEEEQVGVGPDGKFCQRVHSFVKF